MKKTALILGLLLSGSVLFTSCRDDRIETKEPPEETQQETVVE